MTSKKYKSKVEQSGDNWIAQITRQISSDKVRIVKQRDDLQSETEANEWAKTTLDEFVSIQKLANQRQNSHRKETDESSRLRVERHEQKLSAIKAAKKAAKDARNDKFTGLQIGNDD